MRVGGDHFKPQVVGFGEVGVVEFFCPGQRCPVGKFTADRVLTGGGVYLIPGVQVHVDAPNHHGGAAGFPRLRVTSAGAAFAPHDVVEAGAAASWVCGGVGGGVHGAVYLPEQVTRCAGARPESTQEPVLHPPNTPEGAGVFGEHPLGVGEYREVVTAQLQQQVAAGVGVLQLVDGGERR